MESGDARSQRRKVIRLVALVAAALVVVAAIAVFFLLRRASPVEAAVADRIRTSASGVSCEHPADHVLEDLFYCEAGVGGGRTDCYQAFFDADTEELTELTRLGFAVGSGCDNVFDQ